MIMSLDTYDKKHRTISIPCAKCAWKFRCPVEQLQRVICHACEEPLKNYECVLTSGKNTT